MPNNTISDSDLTPFTPFVSGCGVCNACTDYYKQQQYGGRVGNYSNDCLIPQSNGQNLYTARDFTRPLDKEFINRNEGIDYRTTFGGSKNIKEKKDKGKKDKSPKKELKEHLSKKGKMPKHKGGTAEAGATPMNQRFFDPNAPISNYGPLSGLGVMSAYGPIEPGDVGVGMLAPYTNSDCPYANPNTDIKTGGFKKKNIKGRGLISYISPDPINSIGNTIDTAISDFTSFLQNLDNEYVKSTQIAESIKIGKDRLIEGGGKEKKSKKMDTKMDTKMNTKKSKSKDKEIKSSESKKSKDKEIKRTESKDKEVKRTESKDKEVKRTESKDKEVKRTDLKKPESKKSDIKKVVSKKTDTKKIKKGGSNGSDFALTLNSRGPVNHPDHMWGIDGEKWFRQFTKTGEYIPNSQLKYAATPLLAGKGDNNVVVGYNESDLNYIPL